MTLAERIKQWGLKHVNFLFAVLRNTIPIFRFRDIVLVSRFDDVQEVLSRPNVFGVTYAEKMGVITDGDNFFLGMNDTPRYTRDVTNMRSVIRRSDAQEIIAPMIEELASTCVSNGGGDMDIVQGLTQAVPALFCDRYLGIPGPSHKELIEWTTIMFQYLFFPDNPPQIDDQARDYAKKTRAYLDRLIQERQSSRDIREDALGRCIRLQQISTPGMTDLDIRNNLIGIIIGAVPTTSKFAAQAIDYLLDHPQALAQAQAAAARDDTAMVQKIVWEAIRFNTFGAGVFRIATQPYTIAAGCWCSKRIKSGAKVIALTQSAMFDGRKFKRPRAFRSDRPDYHYMHFGYGMHTCFGQYINLVQIPIIVKSLLKCANLRRAPGEAGKMQWRGPFPEKLQVLFDPVLGKHAGGKAAPAPKNTETA